MVVGMRKILSIVSNNIEAGGVESYLINCYKHINIEDVEIDLLVPGKIVYQKNAEDFISLGCNIIELHIYESGIKRICRLFLSLSKIMKSRKYDIVHVNTGNLTIEAIALRCAKNNGIPIRVAHSHGTLYTMSKAQEFVRSCLRYKINSSVTHRLACSTSAAEALFGEKYINSTIIAKNGIDAEKYIYKPQIRERVREENGWNDSYIIGSVGRIAPEKNYGFVLQVFEKVLEKIPNSRLILIGDGEEKLSLEEEAKIRRISSKVSFLGIRKDVPELLQGIDIFVLASKREALGIVNIEAQASGLHCIVSDVIPKEVNLTGRVSFLSLDSGIDKWAEKIIQTKDSIERKDLTDIIKEKGYDFSTSYRIIEEIYHSK